MNSRGIENLSTLCRNVIVSNLERYPGEAFAILDEQEWDNLIKLKHTSTRPRLGKGGLDGSGRMNPVVSDKFITEVEENVPHFAYSEIVDTLVWKDLVNFRFKPGGLSRPKRLLYPYPILEARIKAAGAVLIDLRKRIALDAEANIMGLRAVKCVCESPMDITLLESTGIGKTVQKFIKYCTKNENKNFDESAIKSLMRRLEDWKQMARDCGVLMKEKNTGTASEGLQTKTVQKGDLVIARECKSWRQLYVALKEADKERRESQGARMRERRERLNSERPKIVKVRHKRDINVKEVLTSASTPQPLSSKMQKLRDEARIMTTRRSPAKIKPIQRGFGAAVAFASVSKRKKTDGGTIVNLGGYKRMTIPDTRKPAARDWKRRKFK